MVKFNKEQLQAINHFKGACAVIAGAGSGKSTVLVNRIQKLIENCVMANEIVAITFTKNSAEDLKLKLQKLNIDGVTVGTFHAICSHILFKEGVDIRNQIKLYEIDNLFKKIDPEVDVSDVMSFISYQKCYMKSFEDQFIHKDSKYSETELRVFYKLYESYKKQNKCFDLDDILIECYNILSKSKHLFEYILVDEHQDSNLVQNLLIDKLCPSGNVFCVFDYRQAIYTFRGGNPEYCMNFKKQYPNATIINLDNNYRSAKNVVDNANLFIKNYYGNYIYYSDSIANNQINGNINLLSNGNKEMEAKTIVKQVKELLSKGESPKDICILYRLNSNSMYIESELKANNIEYHIENNSSFFKRKEIEAIISYLRLIKNPNDNNAFEIIFKFRAYHTKYLGNAVLNSIKTLSARKNLSYYECLDLINVDFIKRKIINEFKDIIESFMIQHKRNVPLSDMINNIILAFKICDYIEENYSSEEEIEQRLESLEILKTFIRSNTLDSFITFAYSNRSNKTNENKNCIKLMSIHKSKGLEFNTVFLVGIEDGKFPHEKSELIDEARLFYVGITRSKTNLYLSEIFEDNLFTKQYFNL